MECALIVHFPSSALTLSDFLPHLFHIFHVSIALFLVSLRLHLVPRLCVPPHSWSVCLFGHVSQSCGSCFLHVPVCWCFFGLCFYLFIFFVFLAFVVLGFAPSWVLVASFCAWCLYFVFHGLWSATSFTGFCSFICLSPCV